jgi:hypothetical protein
LSLKETKPFLLDSQILVITPHTSQHFLSGPMNFSGNRKGLSERFGVSPYPADLPILQED